MDYQVIKQFLTAQEVFKELPISAIETMASKMRSWRYNIGNVVLSKEKMSPQIVVIYQGDVRLLGYDPRTGMPISLQLLKSGGVMGWVSLVREKPCETAIASTEVVCLTIPHQEFANLIQEYPVLKAAYQDRVSTIELFDLLGQELLTQAQGEAELKELVNKAQPDAEVYYLNPGTAYSRDHSILQDPEKQWFLSGGEIEGISSGSSFTVGESIKVKGNKPARLVGIPRSVLQQVKVNVEKNNYTEDTGTLEDSTRVDVEEIPYASVEVLDEEGIPITDAGDKTDFKDKKKYPFYSGKTQVEATVACFKMVSKYFRMPFKEQIVKRTVNEQLSRQNNISIEFCGAVTELMGLHVQLLAIPKQAITRIAGPILTKWQDSLVVVYEISNSTIIVADPKKGLLQKSVKEFLNTWDDQPQILLVKTNKETPQERFGLRWFLPYITKYRWPLTEVFVASFFVQLFALFNPLMVQIIIDKVIVQNTPDTLHVLGVLLLIVGFFEAWLTYLRTNLFADTTNRIDMGLGSQVIDHLVRLPLRYFEKRPVGEISTRVNELENIRQFLTGTALTVVLDAIFSVIYIVVMFFYSPILSLVALGVIPLFVAMTFIFAPIIQRQLRTKAERNAVTQSHLVEIMSGIQTVKAQNIELRSRWQWQEKYSRYISSSFNNVQTSNLASSLSNFLNKLSGLLVLWVGAYLVLDQQLTLGQLIAFRIIAGYVTSPILRLAQLWQNFQETALSLERLADIIDNPQEGEQDRDNIPMPLISGTIKYDDVNFRFKPQGDLQLKNVDLYIPQGTFVGIVGQSGAGKSTLAKLVSRLYEPESGRILIDGYDVSKVELYSLRSQVGVVPQEPLLFEGTIQENIAITNPDATYEEIVAAARAAAAHEFIMSLPNGYNSRVGERGASLSGGQRQRIAIARTIMQSPRILVMDEATSALDYATEREVCINLKEAFSDRTVLFITHRLASIRDSDLIVVMDAGAVVERGTHQELMASKGRYYYLYQQQGQGL